MCVKFVHFLGMIESPESKYRFCNKVHQHQVRSGVIKACILMFCRQLQFITTITNHMVPVKYIVVAVK